MAGIRTVMVTTPGVLRDLIKRLAVDRVELEVVAEFAARRGLARRLKAMRPSLVVMGLRRNETTATIRALLVQVPDAKFVTFSSNGRSTLGFELRLYETDLGNTSPNALTEFINTCASTFNT